MRPDVRMQIRCQKWGRMLQCGVVAMTIVVVHTGTLGAQSRSRTISLALAYSDSAAQALSAGAMTGDASTVGSAISAAGRASGLFIAAPTTSNKDIAAVREAMGNIEHDIGPKLLGELVGGDFSDNKKGGLYTFAQLLRGRIEALRTQYK
jgi:hypothetical protein